ncbi:MBL fold metallo-hydrolase [Halovulum sp. GXIMD14793]
MDGDLNAVLTFPHETPPAEGTATEIAPGILWIRMPLPIRLNHVNVYALDDGDGWTIVDTGFYTKRSVEIWQQLLTGPLAGKPVQRVILTHHHPDHIGMAGWFKTEHGAEIWSTRTAWLLGRMLTLDVQDMPPPELLAYYRSMGIDNAELERRKTARPMNFVDVVHPIPLGFRRIQAGDRITMGGRDWIVRIGHGHAPEHATFWSDDDIVMAGDQILPGISSNLGVYATEPDADPVGDWLDSCTQLKAFARPEHLVLPGHKLPFTGLETRLEQLIENHHSALKRLLPFLSEARTAHECLPTLFKRNIAPDSGEYGLALVESYGHLNHLHQIGRITRWRRDDGAWLWQAT